MPSAIEPELQTRRRKLRMHVLCIGTLSFILLGIQGVQFYFRSQAESVREEWKMRLNSFDVKRLEELKNQLGANADQDEVRPDISAEIAALRSELQAIRALENESRIFEQRSARLSRVSAWVMVLNAIVAVWFVPRFYPWAKDRFTTSPIAEEPLVYRSVGEGEIA